MKTKLVMRMTLACVAVLIALAGQVRAGIIVTENFDSYTVGSALNSQNGGTGFTTPWSGVGSITSLGAGGSNAASNTGGFSQAFRALPATGTSIFGSNAGELWTSFDYFTSVSYGNFSGLGFYAAGAERILIGKNGYGGGVTNTNWQIAKSGGLGNVTDVSFATINTAVVRFDLAAGSADLWIGNGVGAVDVSGASNASLTGINFVGIDRIALRGNTSFTVDDIRIGTTSNDVSTFSAVPEPASLAIFGTICLVACGRRRKS